MLEKYKTRAIILIGLGIVCPLLSGLLMLKGTELLFWVGFLGSLLGSFCFLSGCVYYAESKGYSWILGLLLALLLNIWGIIILLVLSDRYKKGKEVKIPAFFPEEKKGKFFLIFAIIVLLIIWIIVGIRVIKIRGIGKEFEEATKVRKEFGEMMKGEVKDEGVISEMEKIQNELSDMLVEAHFGPGVYTDISCNHPNIKKFCDEIKKRIGVKPTIHSTGNVYCAYIRLPSGEYSCIDSSSQYFPVKMATDPSSPGYCDGTTFSCKEQKEKHQAINIISPTKEEEWKEGQIHSIKWQQWGLAGEKVKICLGGHKETSPGYYGQHVFVKKEYRGSCREGDYQITEEISSEIEKYDWKVPYNFPNKFIDTPDVYTMGICPSEEISEYCWRSNIFRISEE